MARKLIRQLCIFTYDQVTVTVSGEQLQNNFVNPMFRAGPPVGVVNTTSATTKPVEVSLFKYSKST